MSLVLGELSTILKADDRPMEQGLKRGEGRLRDAKGRYVKIAKDTGEATGEATGGGFLGKLGPLLKGGAVAAATAAALALGVAFVQALDVERAQDKLAAQLGGSNPEWSAELGEIAGNLYADAYGESMGAVTEAIRAVMQAGAVMEDESSEQIEAVTAKAMDLATAFDEEVGETARAVGQMIRNGLAKDAAEALDILTRGFQETGDPADDLLDTVTEYSTKFRDLGLSGAQAMGLLTQGLRAGARDTDYVADALKEFAIRAIDGSESTKAGFDAIGLSASKMAAIFARGGPGAAKALDLVLDRLRAIKDPAERDAAAVALFGTKAEDLGDALYALDPSEAVAMLGQVGGAADRMGETLNDNAATRIESFKRKAMGQLTELAGGAIGLFQQVADDPDTQEFLGKASAFIDQRVVPALRTLWSWIQEKVIPVLRQIREDALDRLISAWQGVEEKVDENREQLEQFGAVVKAVAEWVIANLLPVLYMLYTEVFARLIDGIGFVIEWISFWVDAFGKVKGAVTGVASWVGDKIEWIVTKANGLKKRLSFSGLFDGIKSALKSALNWVITRWNNLSFSIPSVSIPGIGSVGGGTISTPNIPMLAKGGNILREGLAVVGDAGPELVRLGRGAQVQPLASGSAMAGLVGVLRIILQWPDGRVIKDQLVDAASLRGQDVGPYLGIA
ncbi:phage tail tape measure protein [Phytohabitans aurantiacus]|uniref:Phage tail tape measure protein domain-containing protein n=1 Tax=Phytohabitans aurantiacus TaxID=3016789 RepID=A0ABQ5QSS4_9ACTN|nr:phage tail tape measure protein [Phytohabitans aurantiacus]GLH97340.1 hypothetical protein Pa4123_26150 [Phytohabitans aurantiacus]